MGELISIIVPIYKVENYLKRCINSLIGQTYKNIEIILVDDGSPDGCGEICDEYAKKDRRIRVIHKKNGGLSDARNKGIEAARGKYIGLVDSDDYIHPKMYEILYKNLTDNHAEMAICDYQEVYEDDVCIEKLKEQTIEVLDKIEAMKRFYGKTGKAIRNVVAWNKLYCRTLFDDIRYPYGKIHEDEFTTPKLFYLANKIVYTDLKMYYYMKRTDSITSNEFDLRRIHFIEALVERIDFYEERQLDELLGTEIKHTLVEIENFMNNMLRYGKRDKKMQKQLLLYVKNILKTKSKYLTLRQKIGYCLFCILPGIKGELGSIIRKLERK